IGDDDAAALAGAGRRDRQQVAIFAVEDRLLALNGGEFALRRGKTPRRARRFRGLSAQPHLPPPPRARAFLPPRGGLPRRALWRRRGDALGHGLVSRGWTNRFAATSPVTDDCASTRARLRLREGAAQRLRPSSYVLVRQSFQPGRQRAHRGRWKLASNRRL